MLAHEIRNSIGGMKLALRDCDEKCPKAFHNIEVRQTLVHNINRMERALTVYETHKKLRNSESGPDSY